MQNYAFKYHYEVATRWKKMNGDKSTQISANDDEEARQLACAYLEEVKRDFQGRAWDHGEVVPKELISLVDNKNVLYPSW